MGVLMPVRVRGRSYASQAQDARIVGVGLAGPLVAGSPAAVHVTVESSSGGSVTVSGVIAYSSETDNVVIGHFDTETVDVPAGGQRTVTLRSKSPISSIYVGQNLEFLFALNNDLSGVQAGTSVSSIHFDYSPVFATVGRGNILTSPYFVPAAVGFGVLALGSILYLSFE